ncbi:hypothetical protein [Bradyrhizobium canariense]|uniref:hypothetical protein n=1 Tax=Bradyrhizobium canariense TaxID=255045 RepID=UPI001F0ABCBB|nr:hypothetical protein [Bradyrhizobium canariense]
MLDIVGDLFRWASNHPMAARASASLPGVLREKFIDDHPNAARKLAEGVSRAVEWA